MSNRTITLVVEIHDKEKANEFWDLHGRNEWLHGSKIISLADGDLAQTCRDRSNILVDRDYGALYHIESEVLKQSPVDPDGQANLEDADDVEWQSLSLSEKTKMREFMANQLGLGRADAILAKMGG